MDDEPVDHVEYGAFTAPSPRSSLLAPPSEAGVTVGFEFEDIGKRRVFKIHGGVDFYGVKELLGMALRSPLVKGKRHTLEDLYRPTAHSFRPTLEANFDLISETEVIMRVRVKPDEISSA